MKQVLIKRAVALNPQHFAFIVNKPRRRSLGQCSQSSVNVMLLCDLIHPSIDLKCVFMLVSMLADFIDFDVIYVNLT